MLKNNSLPKNLEAWRFQTSAVSGAKALKRQCKKKNLPQTNIVHITCDKSVNEASRTKPQ